MQGMPCGHFVVLCGYDAKKNQVAVADPFRLNPLSPHHNKNDTNHYMVSVSRLLNAIMLGILSYDANLLIIHPKKAD